MVSTLAEAVDKALETRNFNNVYELIEVDTTTTTTTRNLCQLNNESLRFP